MWEVHAHKLTQCLELRRFEQVRLWLLRKAILYFWVKPNIKRRDCTTDEKDSYVIFSSLLVVEANASTTPHEQLGFRLSFSGFTKLRVTVSGHFLAKVGKNE